MKRKKGRMEGRKKKVTRKGARGANLPAVRPRTVALCCLVNVFPPKVGRGTDLTRGVSVTIALKVEVASKIQTWWCERKGRAAGTRVYFLPFIHVTR